MPRYSTSPDQPSPRAAQAEMFIPFVAHIRVVPDLGTGKRNTYYRNLEKIALRVEEDLDGIVGLNIATPVAYTPQFGDFSARLTIVGFYEKSSISVAGGGDGRHNEAPTTDIQIIHSGTDIGEATGVVTGNRGGSLAEAQDTTATVSAEVDELRTLLAASTTQFDLNDITHIEYNGVKYGLKKVGGRSFGS